MKTAQTNSKFRRLGFLTTEMVVAMGILALTILPLAFSFSKEGKLFKGYYYRSVAMEIVDGEMEILVAGGWKSLAPGTREYPVTARAATNLPPGNFLLTVNEESVRLEWRPEQRDKGGPVAREVVRR